MAHIFLFRHAQSIDGAKNVFSGWRNPDLSEEGVKEAQEIREELKNQNPTKAYTSDLVRCVNTLKIVLEPHENVEVFEDIRLRERNYGDLSGKNKDEVKRQYPDDFPKWRRSYEGKPPGGESILEVDTRVSQFLNEMISTLKPSDVVFICASGNSLRPIRKRFEKMTNEEMASFEHTPAKIYEYEI